MITSSIYKTCSGIILFGELPHYRALIYQPLLTLETWTGEPLERVVWSFRERVVTPIHHLATSSVLVIICTTSVVIRRSINSHVTKQDHRLRTSGWLIGSPVYLSGLRLVAKPGNYPPLTSIMNANQSSEECTLLQRASWHVAILVRWWRGVSIRIIKWTIWMLICACWLTLP